MKRVLAFVLAFVMVLSMAACGKKATEETTTTAAETTTTTAAEEEIIEGGDDLPVFDFDSMGYDDYCAAAMDDEVTVLCYVQATQSWWDDKITVYAADEDGAYFIYEMSCSEEDAAALVPGACIIVSGYKSEWAGEVEIVDASFVLLEGFTDPYVAEAADATDKIGDDEALLAIQNQLVSFKGMTVESVSYKNDEPGDDIYLTVSKNGVKCDFCLEYYLNGSDEALYNAVGSLEAGQIVDIEGFLYWYNGMNPHITKVEVTGDVNAKSEGVMSYDEFIAAAVDDEVVIEAYVQATQSWWDNKITVYAADAEGGYFIYELACDEADAEKLVPGAKIKVSGYKGEWSGEIEVVDATFELVEDGTEYVAPAVDATGAEDLAAYMNQKVMITDMTVSSVAYKNDQPGDDIYVTLTRDGVTYEFCLEYYLNGSDEEFYNRIGGLEEGAVVDVEGFMYWYNGPNMHITGITVK